MGNTVVWKPASTAAYSAYFLMRLFQEAGLPTASSTSSTGRAQRSATRRWPARASRACTSPARRPSSRACGARSARTSPATRTTRASSARPAARTSSSRTPPRTSTPSRPRSCAARSSTRARSARPPRAIFAPSNLWPALRDRLAEEVAADPHGRRRRLLQLHGRRHRREGAEGPPRGDRARARAAPTRRSSPAAASTTREGFFVEPTVIETTDPEMPLMREELFGPIVTTYVYPEGKLGGDAGPRRPRLAVRAHRRGLLGRPRRGASSAGGRAPLRGRQLLRQRQADRRGRRPAAVRRRARLGHERQGRARCGT